MFLWGRKARAKLIGLTFLVGLQAVKRKNGFPSPRRVAKITVGYGSILTSYSPKNGSGEVGSLKVKGKPTDSELVKGKRHPGAGDHLQIGSSRGPRPKSSLEFLKSGLIHALLAPPWFNHTLGPLVDAELVQLTLCRQHALFFIVHRCYTKEFISNLGNPSSSEWMTRL